MKIISRKFLTIGLVCSLIACKQTPKETETTNEAKLPRVAIAGLGIESSTFSPAVSEVEAFHSKMGEAIFDRYPFMHSDSVNRIRAQWYPALVGKSLPGGIVSRRAYDSLMNHTLRLLKANLPYDGLFFDIHGAMSVQGIEDPEGDMIAQIRKVVGPETLISTSMDLHGNVSERLAQHSDLITCYRMAPHEDALESKQRAVDNLLDRLESGKGKPKYKAWIPVPILLPGEKTSTRIEPGKSLYAQVAPLTKENGVIDAAIWIGYAWADEPRNHAVVMAVGDDEQQVSEAAEQLAAEFWRVRHEFEFVATTTTFEDAMRQALASDKKPFIISDMGDNPTAGGAGDVTWTLNELLQRPEFKKADGPQLIYASIPGPDFVEKAVALGKGAQISATAGADVDNRFAGPVLLEGTITAIRHGDTHAETEVVVQVGSLQVIVTKKRKPYHKEADFTNLGLKPREADIVMVKIGYLVPELYNIRADWVMALTPGGVDQDLERLGYKNIKRPMFPLDADMKDPDLSTRWIPLANE
ncbi:M81 family metallopeptidase [Sediminicola luteus]|uniref:Microcystin degradation protein MlrC n=1 Tax=Sediminicola luteus TaxID=319238 RepID=A0A2A4GAX6_9FLAO|nr:M81 family metallopeptidase [Sediminicola luteus]PCE65757.1 microcystin degradation protein MlrC [Sediminicola luteus]